MLDEMIGNTYASVAEPGRFVDGGKGDASIPFTEPSRYRLECKEPFGDAEKETLALLPHLEGAVRLQRLLQHAQRGAMVGEHVAVAMSVASFVLDPGFRIVECNPLAEALLHGDPPLVASVHGQLRAIGKRASPGLREAGEACRRQHRPVRMLVQRQDRSLLRATLTTLPAGLPTIAGEVAVPSLLLLVELPQDNSAELIERACALFGLTAAEAVVALGLLKGLSIQQIATERNIAVSTARTQLRGVLEKSGFQRQVDLVRALSRLVP